jgi:hypothetical protein
LEPLTGRVPGLAAPCRRHREETGISAAVEEWALARSLVAPQGLRAARFGEMASRAFPETPTSDVVLFGQWLVWLFAFDDLRDDGPLGRDEAATDRLYVEVLAGQGSHPVVRVFDELWRRTSMRMGNAWRATFRAHLRQHRAACRSEARFRLLGIPPSLHEYADLRRQANGPFMFDLAEPILGVDLPAGLRRTPAWQALLEACNDITAWCNDIASAAKERARGDVHNYVLVLAHERGLDLDAAASLVLGRIEERMADLAGAARALPGAFRLLGLDQPTGRDASRVAVTLLGAPRGHLEWLLESGRYATDSAMVIASACDAMPSSR